MKGSVLFRIAGPRRTRSPRAKQLWPHGPSGTGGTRKLWSMDSRFPL